MVVARKKLGKELQEKIIEYATVDAHSVADWSTKSPVRAIYFRNRVEWRFPRARTDSQNSFGCKEISGNEPVFAT
jgi:hypothetical protein